MKATAKHKSAVLKCLVSSSFETMSPHPSLPLPHYSTVGPEIYFIRLSANQRLISSGYRCRNGAATLFILVNLMNERNS